MRRRTVLVMCAQKVIQDLIVRQLSAEFDDLLIVRSTNVGHTNTLLQDHHFDIAVCCSRLATNALLKSLGPKETVTIIFRRDEREPVCEEAARSSLTQISLNENWTEKLFEQFRSQCDPKRFRREARFHILNMSACLMPGHFRIPAEVVNVNSSGFLADFEYRPEYAGLVNGAEVVLRFPDHYPHKVMGHIKSRILRIHILESNEEGLPTKVRVVVLFLHLSEGQSLKLNDNLSLAAIECGPDGGDEVAA